MKLKYICLICNLQVNYLKIHLKKEHNLTDKEYYDKFIKTKTEGFCLLCNKPTKFIKLSFGYRKYCSVKCKANDPELSKITGIKISKTKNNFSNEKRAIILEKTKATCLQKYGVDNQNKLERIKNKRKQTCIDKYGVDNVMKVSDIKQKQLNTVFERYNTYNINEIHPDINHNAGFYKNNIWYDSSWEYKYEQYLIENKINYKYHPNIYFEYFDINNKVHKYWPDFVIIDINGNQEYIEIKGSHFFDENGNFINPFDKTEIDIKNTQLKYKCMIDNSIKILRKDDLIKLNIL